MSQLDKAPEKANAPLSASTLAPTSDARPSSGVPRAHEPAAEPKGTAPPSDGADETDLVKQFTGVLKVAPTQQTFSGEETIHVLRRVGHIGEASPRHGATGSKKTSSESQSAAEHDDDDSSGSDAESYCTAQEDDASLATGSPRDGPRAG